MSVYEFIYANKAYFGLRWLIRKFEIYPNAYYNYLRHNKSEYYKRKGTILSVIKSIYHAENGVPGYRSMRVYLGRRGITISNTTVHKYMNGELELKSITRRTNKLRSHEPCHKVFDNLIEQDFKADRRNQKWVTDFTYLYLSNGGVRYNCSIIDLHDRSLVASITDRNMTGGLAARTLEKAINSHNPMPGSIILHSDRGSQYTSKIFVEFCEKSGVIQSMSKPGCPFDNAPMERYFNTLKNEEINLHKYDTEEELYRAVEDFAYVKYNHVRPHSYNNYLTPFEARYGIKNF